MGLEHFEVPSEKLRWRCDPSGFKFKHTKEIQPLQEFIGQDRAIQAVSFGLAVDQPGYNVFVTGMAGTGKASVIKAYLEDAVAKPKSRHSKEGLSDWCYVYNFQAPDRAKALRTPQGKGKALKNDVARLEERLRTDLQAVFTGKEYGEARQKVIDDSQRLQRDFITAVQEEAQREGFAVQFSPSGVAVLPIAGGNLLTDDQLGHMDIQQRKAIFEKRDRLLPRIEEAMDKVHQEQHAAEAKIESLSAKVAETAVSGSFAVLHKEYAAIPPAVAFLDELKAFAIAHAELFSPAQQEQGSGGADTPSSTQGHGLLPFIINVFVDNSATKGPPIVVEDNPTFSNLFGRVDRRFVMGGYVTDHTLLKPGALQNANDGYLVVDIRSVLQNPLCWEALKRVIKSKEVRPEEAAEALGVVVPQSIRPEAIPLNVKVIATGDAEVYQILAAFDPDFWETFKVRADFDSEIQRTPTNQNAYAEFVSAACNKQALRPFEPGAVAKVVEYGSRLVSDQAKLSSRFGLINDLVIEADYWASAAARELVAAEDVEKALDQKVYRSNLIAERMREETANGVLKVDVKGSAVGQINGLAVYAAGDVAFGRPSRITARTFLGRAGIVNVEREAQLGGKSYNKGILIIGGYFGERYAQDRPLGMSATIAFEQSYGDVDGDSASSTEIYALISSLSDVPLRQDIAVTGSVDQMGDVQAIGGVNQKIEGFYDQCKALGLTGQQGVMIPKSNERHLMLREDIVEAVEQGKFHVYSVSTIDQGVGILTGMDAGERGPDGGFPAGTINFLVEKRLREYSDKLGPLAAAQPANGTVKSPATSALASEGTA